MLRVEGGEVPQKGAQGEGPRNQVQSGVQVPGGVGGPQSRGKGAEVFEGKEGVKAYEKKVAELERMLGQKEVEIALLKNSLRGS